MMIAARPNWPRIVRQIRKPLLFNIGFALAVSFACKTPELEVVVIPALPVSLVGAALGIVLGFAPTLHTFAGGKPVFCG